MKVSLNAFELFLLPGKVVVHVGDLVLDFVKVQITMDILLGDFLTELGEQAAIGGYRHLLVLLLDFVDEIVYVVDLADGIIAALEALDEVTVIVDVAIHEMYGLKFSDLVDHFPADLPGHDALAVSKLLGVEIGRSLMRSHGLLSNF